MSKFINIGNNYVINEKYIISIHEEIDNVRLAIKVLEGSLTNTYYVSQLSNQYEFNVIKSRFIDTFIDKDDYSEY